jgi:hypothetical protein
VLIPKKYILWTFLAFVALAMLTGIAAVILPRGWVDEEVMITILIVGAYSLGGLIVVILGGIKGSGGRTQRWTLRVSTAALVISMGLFITGIWVGWRWDQYFLKPGAVALSFGLTFVHRLVVCPLRCTLPVFRLCKLIALTTGAITGFIVCAAFITDGFGFYNEIMFRILAISAIVCAGTTIATGALAFFAPKPGDDEQGTLASSIPIDITCPRCNTTINAHSNKDSRCPTCKLHVRIEIKEPRCACGYLLYQLQSDSCPECGKPIPATDQWGSSSSESSAEQ